MAERRMFAKTIVGSDVFLDMPQSTQALYFHLSMRADDDGFVNSPKSIMRLVGCKDDDLKILCSKKFIIPFETGIVVIKHWKIHNYIAKDRYTETKYKNEKAMLGYDENGAYTSCIQAVDECATQVRLGKVRLGKVNIKEEADKPPPRVKKPIEVKHEYGSEKNVLLTDKQREFLKTDLGETMLEACIEELSTAKAMKGYKYKRDDLAIRKWVVAAVREKRDKEKKTVGGMQPGELETIMAKARAEVAEQAKRGIF